MVAAFVFNDTAWKVSKYGVFPCPYFPVFGLNAGKCGPENSTFSTILSFIIYNHWLGKIK